MPQSKADLLPGPHEPARRAAREVDGEFRLAIDTIPGLVWTALPGGHIDFLNRRWCEYTGLSLGEASGWGWAVAIHPDDREGLVSYWRSVLGEGVPGETEARLRRHDGVYRWFLFRAVPLHDAHGRVLKWYGQTTDIDERKRVETLRNGELRLLEMIARGAPLADTLDALCGLVESVTPDCSCAVVLVDSTGTRLRSGAAPSLPPAYNRAISGRPLIAGSSPCAAAILDRRQVICADLAADERWAARGWRALAMEHGLVGCWSTPIYGSDGRVLGTVALHAHAPGTPTARHQEVIEQMTHLASIAIESRRTVEALRESEERFRLMADAVPEVIWLAALEPEAVQYASPGFERIWGVPVQDLYGDPRLRLEFIHPDDRGRVSAACARWVESGDVDEIDLEFRIVRPDGEVRWIQDRAALIRDDAGRPSRVSGISTDITDRKRAEDRLRRSEANLARAQRLSTTGSFSWYAGSGELTLSDETCRILGIEPGSKPTGEAIRDRLHPDDLALLRQMLASGGGDLDFECRVLMEDGPVRYLQVAASATLDPTSGQDEWVGAVRDVTDQRRAEDALHRIRAELAHVARVATLGELTASIAHEVNQPLAGIEMNADACLNWLRNDPPNLDEAGKAVRRAMRDGRRAAEVIARLRALYRKTDAVLAPFDVGESIRDVVALVQAELRRLAVRTRLDLADDLPPALGDRVQLQQVLLNLVLNAVEAMSGVTDRPRGLSIRAERLEDAWIQVSVRDEGTGLAPTDGDRLFDAFYTTKSTGMGMGLSICRSIVEGHGGRIRAVPNEGPGATFVFTVPGSAR